MVAISCQALTWTLVRLQPLEHQLYFAKTPILDLREQTFYQDTNLGLRSTNSQGLQSFLFLRHQPQGLQSNLTSEAPASRTPIQFHFWDTSLKDSNPISLLKHQPQGLLSFSLLRHQPQRFQSFCSQNSSLLSSIYLQLHCSLQTTVSMTTMSSLEVVFPILHTAHTECLVPFMTSDNVFTQL